MSDWVDPEQDLHVVEFKVRLNPTDAALVRALARKTGTPSAVLMRQWVRRSLDHLGGSVPAGRENRRPC